MFTKDITLQRTDACATHIIQAVGSSSIEKSKVFVASNVPSQHRTSAYGSYQEVYDDPDVDVVYIGLPNAFHMQHCLDAIAAGKHVLCEKPFTMNAKEARAVVAAAKERGVFVMEGMWTRFQPLVLTLQKKLYQENAIGDVKRVFCDFGMDMGVTSLPSNSRLRNPALGAGSLLDLGVYSLTWGILALEDPRYGGDGEEKSPSPSPTIAALQTLHEGVDLATSTLLLYPSSGQQAVLTSTSEIKTNDTFCRIEGTQGTIEVHGLAASLPQSFTIYPRNVLSSKMTVERDESGTVLPAGERYDFPKPGAGFYHEADAVANDIAAGRLENATMPLGETIRVMGLMDEIRRQGGARFPQDD